MQELKVEGVAYFRRTARSSPHCRGCEKWQCAPAKFGGQNSALSASSCRVFDPGFRGVHVKQTFQVQRRLEKRKNEAAHAKHSGK